MKTFLLFWLGLCVVVNVVMGCLTGDVKSFIVAGTCALTFGWTCTT